MKYIAFVFTFLALAMFVMPDLADARRIGAGKSFGGKSSFSAPAAKPPVSSGINNSTIGGSNAGAGLGAGAGAGAAAGTMTRNSGMGMMGGMFGGLLAGSLIGSMLGGGAFAGGGFLDILMIGLFVYLAFRLFNSFRGNANRSFGNENQARESRSFAQSQEAHNDENQSTPAHGIDSKEFIEGAKTAYNRLQSSWAKRDLDDIKIFTTSSVYSEIKNHFEEDPEPSTTEIISLSAQINNIEKDRTKDRISVYFTCLMREGEEENAKNVTELWHFVRNDEHSMWLVDGIQQV